MKGFLEKRKKITSKSIPVWESFHGSIFNYLGSMPSSITSIISEQIIFCGSQQREYLLQNRARPRLGLTT
jgi:hypothetical protein